KQLSTLKDDRNALRQALAELDRLGAPDERKAELREEFDRAEPGVWIEVQPGYRIKRLTDWTDIGFQESLNDPMVGHEVPLGVAYLYLALCVRDAVYGDALAPVRHALQKAIEGDTNEAQRLLPLARRMGTDVVDTKHLLRARAAEDGVTVSFQV